MEMEVVRSLGDGIWCLEHPLRMPGGIEIGTRSVLVRLGDGSLLLHSPGPMSNEQLAAVRGLGQVRVIVAPNSFHHLFLEAALEVFPDAALHAVGSVQVKYPALAMQPLTAQPDAAWKDVLQQIPVEGAPKLDEVVFYHPASRTLLLVDLCFNMRRADNWITRVFLGIAGAFDRFGPSRLARSMFKDKAAVRASVDRILEWDFERAVVTHGDIVEAYASEQLRDAFGYLRG